MLWLCWVWSWWWERGDLASVGSHSAPPVSTVAGVLPLDGAEPSKEPVAPEFGESAGAVTGGAAPVAPRDGGR